MPIHIKLIHSLSNLLGAKHHWHKLFTLHIAVLTDCKDTFWLWWGQERETVFCPVLYSLTILRLPHQSPEIHRHPRPQVGQPWLWNQRKVILLSHAPWCLIVIVWETLVLQTVHNIHFTEFRKSKCVLHIFSDLHTRTPCTIFSKVF